MPNMAVFLVIFWQVGKFTGFRNLLCKRHNDLGTGISKKGGKESWNHQLLSTCRTEGGHVDRSEDVWITTELGSAREAVREDTGCLTKKVVCGL